MDEGAGGAAEPAQVVLEVVEVLDGAARGAEGVPVVVGGEGPLAAVGTGARTRHVQALKLTNVLGWFVYGETTTPEDLERERERDLPTKT